MSQRDEWINTRMRRLLHNDLEYSQANAVYTDHFCPKCKTHRMVHDDKVCTMRYEEELCVQVA